MVTHLAWMAARLVSLSRETMYSFLESQSKEEKNGEIMVEAAIQIKYTSTQLNNTLNLGSLSPQTNKCKIFWLNDDTQTHLAWMAVRLVSSNRETRYASAFWRAIMAIGSRDQSAM
jgi:hypothetical protein